jgi:uncharacterized alkaline shock family protein YloU
MEGHARISNDIVARYAADAAREVPGVRGLVESPLHRRGGVRISGEGDALELGLHLEVEWGTPLQSLGRDVQERVAAYLQRMADTRPATIDVIVDEIAPPGA